MVSRKNVGCRQDLQPPSEGASGDDLKIQGGPLYTRTDICDILNAGLSSINLWTEDCNYDVSINLEWEMMEVHDILVLAMAKGKFLSSEWCHQSGNGPMAPCDSYRVSRQEWIKTAKKEMLMSYFLKFAISKTGKILLIVSCHLSN